MEKKRNFGLLIAGSILLIVSILFAVYTYNTSYQKSVAAGSALSEVKKQISDIESGAATGDLESLNAQKSSLSAEKLTLERPYSYSLILLFFSVMLTIKGIYNAVAGTATEKADIKRMAQAGLLAALCYIGFAFFKIDIPVGPGKTAFHFGNVFCVLAALLLGGYWGGLAAAVGMTIGDLTTSYVTSAPKTFLLKLCIGLIVGLIAHKLFKLSQDHSAKYVTGVTILASVCGHCCRNCRIRLLSGAASGIAEIGTFCGGVSGQEDQSRSIKKQGDIRKDRECRFMRRIPLSFLPAFFNLAFLIWLFLLVFPYLAFLTCLSLFSFPCLTFITRLSLFGFSYLPFLI